jgi:photosystem I subunit IV
MARIRYARWQQPNGENHPGRHGRWLGIIRCPCNLRPLRPLVSYTSSSLSPSELADLHLRVAQSSMASTNMASATSRFMLAAGVPTTNGVSSGRVSFASAPNRLGRRLVVRAEEEAAEPAKTEGEGAVATKPKAEKPPPIGPKRGAKVRWTVPISVPNLF